jgi:hypothetical protein
LSWDEGHKASGFKWRVVAAYKAYLIKWSDIPEMAKRLGNPLYYEVKQPDEEASRRIQEWFSLSNFIPSDAWYLVLLDTYYCAMANPLFSHNWIEVTVLGKLGKELSGWEKAYFPAHQNGEWVEKMLSTLREQTANIRLSQGVLCFESVSC